MNFIKIDGHLLNVSKVNFFVADTARQGYIFVHYPEGDVTMIKANIEEVEVILRAAMNPITKRSDALRL